MFKLSKKYTVDRPIPESDYFCYTSRSLGIVNDENKKEIEIPRKSNVFFLKA